jgi:hypothetical protein
MGNISVGMESSQFGNPSVDFISLIAIAIVLS